MEKRAKGEAASQRKQSRDHIQRQAVQMGLKQGNESGIPIVHQKQGAKEVTAKLPVSGPGLFVCNGFKGEGIDQNGFCSHELDIISTGVLKPQTFLQSSFFHLAEAPFIRIGNKGQLFGYQELGREESV